MLIGTGVVNYLLVVGLNLEGLTGGVYAILLCLKLGLFGLMLGLAALNRFHLTPLLQRSVAAGDYVAAIAALRRSMVLGLLASAALGGYALARSGHRYAFWILIAALIFRAMPHITLVSGYLLPFFQLNIWGYLPTTIIVLVAINQPCTLWMLHSFFLSIPKDLDESASALFEVLTSGAVKVDIGQTFPLAQARQAHEALEGRGTVGSTLLIP